VGIIAGVSGVLADAASYESGAFIEVTGGR
jgi:hypothetical protein